MTQPPQNGWGSSAPGQDHSFGLGAQGGYGQGSPNAFGQGSAAGYGQPSANSAYGQGAPVPGYEQGSGGYGQGSYASSFGTGPTEPVEPPKKGGGKIAIIVCAGCAVLALLLALAGGGIWLFTRDRDTSSDPTAASPTDGPTSDGPTSDGPTSDGPTSDGPTSDSPSPTDPPTTDSPTGNGGGGTAPAGSNGTKDAPLAPNTMFTLEDGSGGTVDVTVGTVNWDATKAVMDANSFNQEPTADETYIVVPVKLTYHGDGSFTPLFGVSVDYVSASGNTFSADGVTAKSRVEVGELFDGGSADYDEALLIPKNAVKDGGVFRVRVALNPMGDEAWVAAK